MGDRKDKPLMQRLYESGYPVEAMHHHYSDLYVYATPLTERIIDEWLEDNGWAKLKNDPFMVSKFVDQITGKPMFDIAFQYLPYWGGKTSGKDRVQRT